MLTNRKINPDLLEKTITLANQKYLSGKEQLASAMGSKVAPMIRRRSLTGLGSTVNQNFMNYDADIIESNDVGHKLIASAAPTDESLPYFCQELVYHDRFPVTQIITFGTQFDFPILEANQQCARAFDLYQPTIAASDDKPESDFIRQFTLTVKRGAQQVKPVMTESREVKVSLINLNENSNLLDLSPQQIQAYWTAYETMRQHNTVIYCDDGNLSGQLIFTFELLRNFGEIFKTVKAEYNGPEQLGQDAIFCAENIIKLLADLRKDRKGLVSSAAQFEQAIRFADVMNQYRPAAVAALAKVKPERVLSGSSVNGYGRFGFAGAAVPALNDSQPSSLTMHLSRFT
jgi:hypothetical protein